MHTIIHDQQELANWCRSCEGPMDFAVAFWGDKALDYLGITAERQCRILLDISAGATNPKVLSDLVRLSKKNNVQAKKLDRLHAKVYLAGTQLVVGSANASANGLGAEGHEATHWKELCLLTDNAGAIHEARQWFEEQWEAGKEIKPADIALARDLWKKRRRQRPEGELRSLLEVAMKSPEELEDRDFYICVTTEPMGKEDEKQLSRISKAEGRPVYAFADWPGIPIDKIMLCFVHYDGASVRKDEPFIARTPPSKKRSKFKFVTAGDIGDYVPGELGNWKSLILRYKSKFPKEYRNNGGLCMPIVDFVSSIAGMES